MRTGEKLKSTEESNGKFCMDEVGHVIHMRDGHVLGADRGMQDGEMEYGQLAEFFKGLDGHIGLPHPRVLEVRRREQRWERGMLGKEQI
eukprot:1576455-Rhodomonas_salina.2